MKIALFILFILAAAEPIHATDLIDDDVWRAEVDAAEKDVDVSVERLLARSGLYLNARRYDKAEQMFRTLIEQGIEHPLIYGSLSVALGKQRKYAEAIGAADHAIALDPANAMHPTLVKASWVYKNGDHVGGAKLFQSVSKPTAPEELRAYHGCLACFSASTGDVEGMKVSIAHCLAGEYNAGGFLTFLRRDVVFDPYRAEAWFIALAGPTLAMK